MGDRIKITTDELRFQGQELGNLADEYEALYNKANESIKKMKNASSAKLAANLLGKTTQLTLYFSCLTATLRKGAQVANQCADNFENTDSALRKLYSDTLSDEVKNSPVSGQRVLTDFQYKVETMQEKVGFMEGDDDKFGYQSGWINYNGVLIMGTQCYAMAHIMQLEIMGSTSQAPSGVRSFDEIQTGDVVNYYGKDCNDYEAGHWVFVIEKKENSIVIGEGNALGKGIVHYREIPRNLMQEIRRVDRVG